jgi:hypothetical protein
MLSTQRSLERFRTPLQIWIAVAFWRGSLQSMSSPALMLEQRSSGMPALRQTGARSVSFATSFTDSFALRLEQVDRVFNPLPCQRG